MPAILGYAMSKVPRKAPRKPSTATGYLYSTDGWPLGECQMKDISQTGAMLVHDINEDMPAQFLLAFSRNGQVRRRCQVVWQKENRIGVRFVGSG
jgi:PilZ domain-containing protein